jgi:hypothetical protein
MFGGTTNLSRGYGGFNTSPYGIGSFGNVVNQGNVGGPSAGRPPVRTSLQLGFQASLPAATEVSARFARRLPRIPGLESASGVAVSMDGRTAVLQGVVASQNQRDLIGRLALFEPGISDVRNELTVDPRVTPRRVLPKEIPSPPR